MASINWAEKHSVEEVKMMLHVGQIIDPHQDNQIDKQLQKKHENGKNMADAEIQDKLKHKQEVVKQQEIQQKEDFRQRKLQQKQAIKQQRPVIKTCC